jgi:hypothetical protein
MPKDTEKSPSASPKSADYPVEPAERLNQEARLRKAAAAGANFPKSPLAALMPRSAPLTSSTPASVQPAPAESNPPRASDISSERNPSVLPATDHGEEMLVELKKISAWADLQRKLTKWSFVIMAMVIFLLVGVGIMWEQRLNRTVDRVASPGSDWVDVERNLRSGDFDKAIALGESLLQQTPQYPEAHQRLAGAYLAAGKIDKAREHYAEAFRLFPSEQNEKLLDAIERRASADKP